MVWNVCLEREVTISFLEEMNEEISPPIAAIPRGIDGVVDLLLSRGQILVARERGSFLGLLGYVLGEPAKDFSNISVGYIYLAMLRPHVRRKYTILKSGLKCIVKSLEDRGVTEVRFKAHKENKYTNTLYSKLATPLREEANEQGVRCILYGAELADWKRRFG